MKIHVFKFVGFQIYTNKDIIMLGLDLIIMLTDDSTANMNMV